MDLQLAEKFSVPLTVQMINPEEVKRFSRVQSLDRKVSGIASSGGGGGSDQRRLGGNTFTSPASSSAVPTSTAVGPAQTQQHLVASSPRLMFPRCANENDMGAVEVARRESQHFLRNTDLIVSQRDEIRQHSKDLVAQAKDVADKLEKTQVALRTFYNTLGKMADTFGINYCGNREIGQELIRLTARHKDACDILTDVSTAFRHLSGSTSSRSSSPDSGSANTSIVDRVSKQFQKECDSARKENDDLKKSMEEMGFKYGSSIQSSRKNSIGKIKKMDTNETNKYLSKASKAKTLFVNTLTQQRKFMCIFCDSICNIVDKELRLAEKFSSCEPIYNNLLKQMTHVDKLPENVLDDIKVAGHVSSTDVVFKSVVNPQNPNNCYPSSNAVPTSEPQYDSISQTSSLGSSTSLSTNASTESPSGTSSSYADSGFPSSRESSHDDPDYRDPAIYFQRAAAFGMAPRHLPSHLSLSAKGGLNAPAPPPRRGSCCQVPLSAMSSSNSLNAAVHSAGKAGTAGFEKEGEGSFGREKKDAPELRVMCNDDRQDSRNQMDPSLIRSYSVNSASSILNSQTIIHQRLSQPVLPVSGINNCTPSPASPGSESVSACYIGGTSTTDIWVPRENVTPTAISKSQSSSTDTLEATDSPGQNRRHDNNIGACGSLSSSTDTLDETCHSVKGSLEPNSPNFNGKSPQQMVEKSSTGLSVGKMGHATMRHSENLGVYDRQSSECEQSNYMTIKRYPRALSVSGGADVTSFSGITMFASSTDDTDIDACEEVTEFMKQLRDQRLALKAVDKTTLDFWDKPSDPPDDIQQ